jgi:hypothetical protein
LVYGVIVYSDNKQVKVVIRFFDPFDTDDEAAKYRMDCAGILDKLGIARYDETTTREETRITNLNPACSVKMTEFRGAVIMPLYGLDLHSYRKLNPIELDCLLKAMFDCITDTVTHGLCINDLKPENIMVKEVEDVEVGEEDFRPDTIMAEEILHLDDSMAEEKKFVMVDMDDLAVAHTRGDYATYCLPEFGKDGTLQMLFQVMLVVAYCSRALNPNGLMMFFHGNVRKTNPTRADIIKCVPAEFQYYIDTIGKIRTAESLAALQVAILAEPYKQWRRV